MQRRERAKRADFRSRYSSLFPPPLLFSRFGSSHAPLCRILRFFAFVLRRKQILVENCEEKKRILRVSLSLRINLFVVVVLKSCAVNK